MLLAFSVVQRLPRLVVRAAARGAGVCSKQKWRGMASPAMEPTEICLPVPWGHVSCKAWGDPSNKPVLALHGWLDNAGSYDRLAPMLASELYVVAVDLPGHGRSSHRPPGLHYDASLYVADIKYIVDALKWERFGLLGHSMGAGAATWFSGAMPEMVDRLVLIEGMGFWSADKDDIPERMGQALAGLFKLNYVDHKTYPTLDAALDRLVEGHVNTDKQFDRESARILSVRGTRQLEDGTYQFTRDVRLNGPSLIRVSHEVNHAFFKVIKCPVLLIVGDSQESAGMLKRLSEVIALLELDKVRMVQVSGGHHLHLYAPDRVQGLISSFLSNHKENKL